MLLCFTIPFILVCSCIYVYYAKYTATDQQASLATNYKKTQNIFEDLLNQLDKSFVFFDSDDYVRLFFKLTEEETYSQDNYHLSYQVNKLIRSNLTSNNYLDSIYLYSLKSDYVTSSRNGNTRLDFNDLAWYTEYERTGNSNFITAYYDAAAQQAIISVVYGVYSYGMLDGLIVYNIAPQNLTRVLSATADEGIRLYQPDGTVLFSTNFEEIGQQQAIGQYTESGRLVCTKHKNILTFSDTLQDRDLYLVIDNDVSGFRKDTLLSNITFILLLVLTALTVPLLISFFLSSDFYKSIAEIAARLQAGDPDHSPGSNFNELAYINQNIMNIITNNQHIEEELVNKVVELKKSQAIALQTQLNPHFLFNTLNAVTLLYAGSGSQNNDADVLIRLLSDILYFSLNTKENIIPIADEISYTKKYIEIERIKYRNQFRVEWEIPDEILRLRTVKFILQPIVENSFSHGFKHKQDSSARIQISARIQEHILIFTVQDNGRGMSPERLRAVRALLASGQLPESKNIGICNVNRRIQLIFGEKYGCSITSSPAGTTVYIKLPVTPA